MSLIDYAVPSQAERQQLAAGKIKAEQIDTKLSPEILTGKEKLPISNYAPTDEEITVRQMIVKHFTRGDLNMRKPRREFNDLPLVTRAQIDRMGFNSYQPNDGDPIEGNESMAWKSNAQRPIIRNKIISIAAHATARLLFPRLFAYDDQNDSQRDAAQVGEDLMEWSADKSDYRNTALYATINALVEPASIVYTDYCETYRDVKTEKDPVTGKWNIEEMLDENLSGFQEVIVPVEELYIENFYEHDIQKQGWLMWRRVQSYSLMEAKYGHMPNFEFVRPGVQTIYDDANRLFYEVYDSTMRQDMCEEIIYWNKTNDLKIIMVNGVVLTEADNPNPRKDKRYPFAKFGYELIDGGRFFYYKSLAFKMMQDAKVINTLYQMIMDGTYLKLFPPMINRGGETIGSDVLIPGAVTSFTDPNSDLKPLTTATDIGSGINAMFQVEQSINATSNDLWMSGGQMNRRQSAYALSIIQQNANTLLGLFVSMISQFVKDFGKLRLGDILQYLTIVDVSKIENPELVYKTFLLPNKQSGGKSVTRKIKFDSTLPSGPVSEEKETELSYDTLEAQGGSKADTELWRVNPELFRNLCFMLTINPDVENPMSQELEKQYGLEQFDRMIAHPDIFNPEQTGRLLLKQYKDTRKEPDKFLQKQQAMGSQNPLDMMKQLGAGVNSQDIQQPNPSQPIPLPRTPAQVQYPK